MDKHTDLQAYIIKMEKDLADLKNMLQQNPVEVDAQKADVINVEDKQKTDIQAMLERAEQLCIAGDYDTVISMCNRILAKGENVEVYCLLGKAFRSKGKYEEAISAFSEAIILDPNCLDAYRNRAGVYTEQKHHERALADYGQAIAIDPNSADLYYERGDVINNADWLS